MDSEYRYIGRSGAPAVQGAQAAQVLRNTYMLLGMSLAFAAAAGWFAAATGVGIVNPWITLGVYFVLLFANAKLQDSAWGLLTVFGITGWLGFTTGPIISAYAGVPGGMEIVSTALTATAGVFIIMSAIALVTRKDFSFMGNFLMVGVLVAFLSGIGALFFQISALALVASGMFVFLSSMLILWQTSRIVHGGETNYIAATVLLFVSLYNLFLSLVHLLTVLAGDD